MSAGYIGSLMGAFMASVFFGAVLLGILKFIPALKRNLGWMYGIPGMLAALIPWGSGYSSGETSLLSVSVAALFYWGYSRATSASFSELAVVAPASTTSVGRIERECPYCAELILAKARLCKHCGRDLIPVSDMDSNVGDTSGLRPSIPVPAVTTSRINAQPDSALMAQYGITFDGQHYFYGGYRYDKYADALAYAKRMES